MWGQSDVPSGPGGQREPETIPAEITALTKLWIGRGLASGAGTPRVKRKKAQGQRGKNLRPVFILRLSVNQGRLNGRVAWQTCVLRTALKQ